jgi:hypothetical protein
MDIEEDLQKVIARLEPLEHVFRLLAASLGEPKLHRTNEWVGFRYDAADVRHFCLLKAARALSAMYAAIELARKGFLQELAVLIRTVIECTTHIEFVIRSDASEEEKTIAKRYIEAYFADSARGVSSKAPPPPIQQRDVHVALGKTLDKYAEMANDVESRAPAEEMYRKIYSVISNFVHMRYPECMDLYGGNPGRFHLHGMSGTPKDAESIILLESYTTTLSNTFVTMAQLLDGLWPLVREDRVATRWYEDHFRDES